MKIAAPFRRSLTVLPVLFLSAVGAESDEQQSLSLNRPGDGRPVCGLGRAFHAGRRAELMRLVGEEVMVFRGQPDMRENLAFRQDKTFWYLTGVESPNASLVLDGKSGRQILFLPERTDRLMRRESWDGEVWDSSDEWIGELTAFEEIRSSGDMLGVIEELLDGRERIGVSLHPTIVMAGSADSAGPFDAAQAEDELDGRPSREDALARALEKRLGVETFDVAPHLIEMRQIKTGEEIAAVRRASRSGALAMIEAMRSTRPGIGEWDLDGLMSWVQIREGADGRAYNAIVGSGGNSCILHYTANNRRMEDGEVVLIDYGPELDHYTTDITRTWPVSGTFSERQAELYDAVLAAQAAGFAAARPGATLMDVHRAATGVFAERGYEDLTRHFTCHWVGQEVHDPGSFGARFVPGMIFTIEPGLYEEETGIGIRIEDVVVITEAGCDVLTDLVPRKREEVEALVRDQGVLDWISSRGE